MINSVEIGFVQMRDCTVPQKYVSQNEVLRMLASLGYEYLSPEEVLKLRKNKFGNVILEDVLKNQLKKINRITFKGKVYPFSHTNINAAVDALKNVPVFDGLITANSKIYDILTLGKSFEEIIDNDRKSRTINYIDWQNVQNNIFHFTKNFEVLRSASDKKYCCDIVLFVNGIPLCIMECEDKNSEQILDNPLDEAVIKHLRNQSEDGILNLYKYSQLLMAVSQDNVLYATTGTPRKFWALWKEQKLKNRNDLCKRDGIIRSLCTPERFLDIIYKYIVFDSGTKKIARYQQYFAIQDTLERIKIIDSDNRRKGGVIWHTQGSGKTLTMVMLAKALSLVEGITDPKVVIVTDRIDLDKQIADTFRSCGKHVHKASGGEDLANVISQNRQTIITTVINKFRSALKKKKVVDTSQNIFVLVDESHRSQYGSINALMQQVFPNACYIGFTGTPLMKKEKNTALKFGGIIGTPYTISQAVEDKAVLPLYYESRFVVQKVNQSNIDEYFDIISKDLSDKQKTDFKKKFASRRILNEDQEIANIAMDVSRHFVNKYKGTGFKGQLTAPDKASALKYKKYLDSFGMVTSEVVISAPDMKEGELSNYDDDREKVNSFWKDMMDRFGSEAEYNFQIINKFKNGSEPDILIVVDKLLTGFDAPKNSVLYIASSLKEHRLLQAIARVNRLEEGKDYGEIIDYYGLLNEIDDALLVYSNIGDFDKKDVQDILISAQDKIDLLSVKYSDLWNTFNGITKYDMEQYEQYLKDETDRIKFYDKLRDFSKTFNLALGNLKFLRNTSKAEIDKYKYDLKFFLNLKVLLKSRYAEAVDKRDYEPKIKKLIDTYVTSDEIIQIREPVDIFNTKKFKEELDLHTSSRSKADTIAYRLKKTISEKAEDDPIFYKKLSELLKESIEKYSKRILNKAKKLKNDDEYLNSVNRLMDMALSGSGDDIPSIITNSEVVKAFYGIIYEKVRNYNIPKETAADLAKRIDKIILNNKYVDWIKNIDLQNKIINNIEDVLFDFKKSQKINLSYADMDFIINESVTVAKRRYA